MEVSIKNSNEKKKCQKCKEFRGISLHIHELFMFCEILDNDHVVYKYSKGQLKAEGLSKTINIAKWLKLASQLRSVEMDTYRYEEAHVWCEPVAHELESNADHHTAIITPLTRFIFVANALEETYRFTSQIYEHRFALAKAAGEKLERKRNYSAQAGWLIDKVFSNARIPMHYEHKVENLLHLSKLYSRKFNISFDVGLENDGTTSYGLSLVRNIRNQIAHAAFPIIDNPEYTLEFSNPETKRLILNLLGTSVRVATMNVQILLGFSNDGFKSDAYSYLCDDPDYGDRLKSLCTLSYLDDLHIKQDFGLNESSQWQLRSRWDEGEG